MMRGYANNLRVGQIEERLISHDKQLEEFGQKIDYFVKTSIPPLEGIFYGGQIFDAYVFVSDLIKSAFKRLVLIDNYVDESVLMMLSKRRDGVSAEVRTARMTSEFKLDIIKYNSQYSPIIVTSGNNIHDRFLIVDDDVYHIGGSMKDLGKKLFAFSKMSIPPHLLL